MSYLGASYAGRGYNGPPYFGNGVEEVVVVPGGDLLTVTTSILGTTSAIPVFDRGDRAQLIATVRNARTGALADAALALTIEKPDGTAELHTSTRQSIGVYIYVADLDVEGRWRFRWTTTGVMERQMLHVRPTED
jgi:hypothetical protein